MGLARVLVVPDVLATAMVAGFLTMYCMTIGGYLSHMVASGQTAALQRTYAPFRRRTHLRITYAPAMLAQAAIAAAATRLPTRRRLWPSSSPWSGGGNENGSSGAPARHSADPDRPMTLLIWRSCTRVLSGSHLVVSGRRHLGHRSRLRKASSPTSNPAAATAA